MITYPNCKINLGLHVVGKRPDGYHDLETIFLPVYDLTDELEITPLNSQHSTLNSQLTLAGIPLDSGEGDNLCIKAWQLLHDEFGIPAVTIRLKKNIPFGAGLGGGSSDAAFTLKMLNALFSLGLTDAALEQHAARLGADCAFFIRNQPAYATGIGDQLEPLPELSIFNCCLQDTYCQSDTYSLQDTGRFSIQIEIPEGEHVSTKEAYAGLNHDLFGTPRPDIRRVVQNPIETWTESIVNDFEASVFPAHPAIAALKDEMYRRGALYASMTGSGAAVFGIFPK